MLEYQKEARDQVNSAEPTSTTQPNLNGPATRRIVQIPSASHAARAQKSGFAKFCSLARSISAPDISSPTPAQPPISPDECERHALEEDKKVVEAEILAYEMEGIMDDDHPDIEDFDLLRYWQVGLSFRALCCSATNDFRARKTGFHFCGRLRSTCYPFKPQQYPVNVFFHQVRKLIQLVAQIWHHLRWKSFKFSSSTTEAAV